MKKAQFWYGDFLIAVMILMVIGLLFASSMIDLTSRNEILKELILDASDISSVLMSEGHGSEEWVEKKGTVGLITDYKFDKNKFNSFLQLNYNKQKSMLGTFNNVWVYLKDKDENIIYSNSEQILPVIGISPTSIEDIGDNGAKNIVSIKRFVFYEADIYILGVVVW